MTKKIGIIGGGVVGLAVKNFFKDAKVYDKFKQFSSLEEVRKQDIIFICVPTPYQNGYDGTVVEEAVSYLKNEKDKIVVLKSTVIPGTTEALQKKYPQHKFCFNPEFLDSMKAKEDFSNPDKQIVGYTKNCRDAAEEVLNLLPKSRYMKLMSAVSAEVMKYMVNVYYATKVIFANQMYDVCVKLGVDYETVREAFEHDRRVAPGNFDVWHGGFRGFDGKCLPKDLASFIDFARSAGVKIPLLEKVQEINRELLDTRNQEIKKSRKQIIN